MAISNEDRLRDGLELLQAELKRVGGDATALRIETMRSNDPFGARGMFYRLSGTPQDSGGWFRAPALLQRMETVVAVLRLVP